MAKKNMIAGLHAQGEVVEIRNQGESVGTSEITPECSEASKPVVPRGRPKSKPDSKATIFHLPLDLIELISAEADQVSTGNKSAFAVKVFSDYFAAKSASL